MNHEIDSFRISDSSIHIWSKGDYDWRTPGKDGDWIAYNTLMSVLDINGFIFHRDPQLHDHRWETLHRTHHAGSKGDVHFHSEIGPRGFKFEFYEDVPRENKHGGRYGFDKMGHAPYLWRKRVELVHMRLVAALDTMGFKDETPHALDSAYLEVIERRRQSMDWHAKHFEGAPDPYSSQDQDRVCMKGNGETRYYYTRNGRLMRGRVYRGLGNVWPVVLNRYDLDHLATYELFRYDPKKHPRKVSLNPLVKISHALELAVKQRNFLKAARIQEALHRMTDSYEFRVGDRVMVDNPRFHGIGTVEELSPPFKIWIKTGSGHTYAYEWATVKPLKEAAAIS